MEPIDPAEIARQLADLRLEHRDLDAAIEHLSCNLKSDELQLKQRLSGALLSPGFRD